MEKDLTGYDYSRQWFDFCFANPELVKPNHTALYFFTIEQRNRLGWKEKFGLPSGMSMEAIGIKSYNTYINTLNDLVEWGFIKMIERSKNQYSSNIVALLKFNKANDKALDKALIKHSTKQTTKQSESTVQSTSESIDSIDKQINNRTIEQGTIRERETEPENSTFILTVNTEKIYDLKKYCSENFQTACERLQMNLNGKYEERFSAFEDRVCGLSYPNVNEVVRYFNNFMNLPESKYQQEKLKPNAKSNNTSNRPAPQARKAFGKL